MQHSVAEDHLDQEIHHSVGKGHLEVHSSGHSAVLVLELQTYFEEVAGIHFAAVVLDRRFEVAHSVVHCIHIQAADHYNHFEEHIDRHNLVDIDSV
jgi:hypothetical protein